MSTTNDSRAVYNDALARLPAFDLGYSLDDRARPTTVTVYDKTRIGSTTNWITAAVDDAVPLEEVA